MPQTTGPLYIIGGKEDKQGDTVVLQHLVELMPGSGFSPQSMAVVTTATEQPEAAFHTYQEVFSRLGVPEVIPLPVDSREVAEQESVLQVLDRSGAVFFTGGDQLRITSTLGGTRLHRRLLERHKQGMVIAGTSAGASAMSHTMIVEGDAERMPTRNTVRMAPGLGLWPGAMLDQHFTQRGRIGRLLSALAQNPDILAIGIDENTAIEVWRDRNQVTVWGANTVTFLDGRDIGSTNASESSPGAPLALTYVRLHVLCAGYGFDLAGRQPFYIHTAHTPKDRPMLLKGEM